MLLSCLLQAGAAAAQIRAARYEDATTRYDHGILGDAVEWASVRLTLDDGRDRVIRLPDHRVFEDLAPRIVDLDGRSAVLVVESDLGLGARAALYGEDGLIAAGPFIGRAHRWLAPVAAADLDGDGRIEIAWVDRPHLAKALEIWRYVPGETALRAVARAPGFSNHRIGWDRIVGGLRDCGGGPELVVPDAAMVRLRAARLTGERIEVRDLGPFDAAATGRALRCR